MPFMLNMRKTAMMMTILLDALFAGAAFAGLATIVLALRPFAAAFRSLHAQVSAGIPTRTVKVSIMATGVTPVAAVRYRPRFQVRANSLPFQPGWRDAA